MSNFKCTKHLFTEIGTIVKFIDHFCSDFKRSKDFFIKFSFKYFYL